MPVHISCNKSKLKCTEDNPDQSDMYTVLHQDFPGSLDSKESACNVGDPGSTPGLGRSPGEGNSSPIQYSCLGNP